MNASSNAFSYFEFRAHALRPGAAVQAKKMRQALPGLLQRASVNPPLGIWSTAVGAESPTEAWLLGWDSLDERLAAWGRLEADSDWQAAWQLPGETRSLLQHADVEIWRQSPFWQVPPDDAGGPLQEVRHVEILNRDAKQGHQVVAGTELPFFQARGASVLGAYTVWFGARTPEAVMLLAWPDLSTRTRALRDYDIDPTLLAVRSDERRTFGRPLFGRTRAMLLHPEGGSLALVTRAAK